MSVSRTSCFSMAAGLALIAGVAWMSQGSAGGMALNVMQVPSDRPRIAASEILSRFPKAKHEEFMRRAIANSRKAGVEYKTGGAFGAVIVDGDGAVIADGMNHVVAQNDPTWHGEMHAIRQACALLKKPKLEGCILYTSSEPCPMCLATAYWASVDGIVYGAKVETPRSTATSTTPPSTSSSPRPPRTAPSPSRASCATRPSRSGSSTTTGPTRSTTEGPPRAAQ